MSRQAISRPNLLLSIIIIGVLASVAVIADTMTGNTTGQANVTVQPDGALQVPGTNGTSNTTDLLGLSTPIQVLQSSSAIPDGYLINTRVLLNTTGYNCSITDNGKVYITCDSIYDGNGDGNCTSGESCLQFGIVGNYITRKERNSQDTFTDHDETFTLRRPEVAQ